MPVILCTGGVKVCPRNSWRTGGCCGLYASTCPCFHLGDDRAHCSGCGRVRITFWTVSACQAVGQADAVPGVSKARLPREEFFLLFRGVHGGEGALLARRE